MEWSKKNVSFFFIKVVNRVSATEVVGAKTPYDIICAKAICYDQVMSNAPYLVRWNNQSAAVRIIS